MIAAMILQQMLQSLSKETSPCCPKSAGQRQWCLPSSAAAAARMSLQRMAMVCSCVFDAILSRTVLALPAASRQHLILAIHYVADHPFSSTGQARASGPGNTEAKRRSVLAGDLANSASLISMLTLCRVQLWRLSERCSRSDIVLGVSRLETSVARLP